MAKEIEIDLVKSYISIEDSLKSSISYEGEATFLLIDELQFLFSPTCVIIHTPQKTFANISKREIDLLTNHVQGISKFAAAEEIQNGNTVTATLTNFRSFPLSSKSGFSPRRAVKKSNELLSIECETTNGIFRIELYLDTASENNYDNFKSERFYKYILDTVLLIADHESIDDYSNLNRLLRKFSVSLYLELVFEHLEKRITKHLSASNDHFKDFIKNPFFLQFFIMQGLEDESQSKNELRFYPLQKQRTILDSSEKIEQIANKLDEKDLFLLVDQSPLEFITSYVWKSDRSFAGYAFECGCSMYEEDWQEDPLVQAAFLSKKAKTEREIGTIIMQTLRDDTPNQFVIPLFAGKRTIGVVLLNCPEDVPKEFRIEPVRSARSIGFPVRLALETDDIVNHMQVEKEKAAKVMAYKHSFHSIMHDERFYCREIQNFIAVLKTKMNFSNDPHFSSYLRTISFMVQDKLQLIDELSVKDPIKIVPESFLYPSVKMPDIPLWDASIEVDKIKETVKMLKEIFDNNENKGRFKPIIIEVGSRLTTIGFIPNLTFTVFARILTNMIKNAVDQAKIKSLKNRELKLSFDIYSYKLRSFLRITCEDNCGGFEDNDIPDNITYESWVKYLNIKDIPRGMGFMILAKYATSSGGSLFKSNVEIPEKGARLIMNIGLKENY